MDNLPVVVVPRVIELASGQESRDIAIGIDVRDRAFIDNAGTVVDEMRGRGVDLSVVYLGCATDTIVRRFSETRRRHPLADTGDFPTAITEEQELLEELRERADVKVDTSAMTVHELKRLMQQRFESPGTQRMTIKAMSYGFKHGPLLQADIVFDARFLPNPYFVDTLRNLSGLSPDVVQYLDSHPDLGLFCEKIEDLLAFLIPRFEAEGKAYLTIGLGCTGGQHRSVAIAERLARKMAEHGYMLHVEHRDQRHWKLVPS